MPSVDTEAAKRVAHAESVEALAAGPKHHLVGDTGLLSRRRGVVELVDSQTQFVFVAGCKLVQVGARQRDSFFLKPAAIS